jgi:hypothetical protein
MMTVLAGLGLVGVMMVTVAAGPGGTKEDANTSPLDVLKRLAGDWVMVGEDGKPTDQVMQTFRVTAGGTAVISTEFPGSEHEMVTLYHMDGDDLILTHYCMLGNQPRMKARRDTGSSTLVFTCVGGTNMRSEDDKHMHQGTFTFVDDDHYRSEWLMHEKGEVTYTAKFDVVRRKAKS